MKSLKKYVKKVTDRILNFCTRNLFVINLLRLIPKGYNHVLDIVLNEMSSSNYVVFDVGANIGQSLRFYFKNLNKPQIYSFEPVSETYNRLVVEHGHRSGVKLINCALGSEVGEVNIQLSHQDLNNSLKPEVYKDNSTNRFETIAVNTIDSYCNEHKIDRIDILKIDTEGFELEVLKGGGSMLLDKRIKYIYAEVGFNREADKVRLQDLIDFLFEYGYSFSGLYEHYRIKKNNMYLLYGNALFYLN